MPDNILYQRRLFAGVVYSTYFLEKLLSNLFQSSQQCYHLTNPILQQDDGYGCRLGMLVQKMPVPSQHLQSYDLRPVGPQVPQNYEELDHHVFRQEVVISAIYFLILSALIQFV